MENIFEKSLKGKNKILLPELKEDIPMNIPDELCNTSINLPDVNETDLVRHYTKLSTMNFGVDSGMYPLGSCTMKYNPKINEKLSSLSGFAMLHPLAGDSSSQGALEVLYDLEEMLCNISGMDAFSLIPAAGSHGELTGVMVIKKHFEHKEEERNVILIADTAHGTNPASVAMCGFDVKEVPSDHEGDVDLVKLSEMMDESVAAMMLTSPNTLGLFDRNVKKIAEMLHENGSLFYCDGANLNAVMGKATITDMGFDLMHINLHKSFSTPHGGGGPGSGPLGVVELLKEYLPVPQIEKKDETFSLVYDAPQSIGKIHSFYGNFLVALRAYVYILMLGKKGIPEVAETAVLNANYLKESLRDTFNLPINRICMHEFILNDENLENHVTTNDIAKRLLDLGFHAPTVYFPLLVPGAMMIEPTETESKESLDSFIASMKQIREEIKNDPDLVLKAPQNTPVKRVDAVLAARKPILKWEE